ncbi:MAG TPA: carboxylesterase family protein [Caulobacteraceae bacterium]|nr:carboxylesterase family protein [Caulobacteraceae bacterium]
MKRVGVVAVASLGLAALAAGVAALVRGARSAATVEIESGRLDGVAKDGVLAFKGVSYAAAPVGPLRWRPPQPVRPWRGVRRAHFNGPLSLQTFNPEDNGVGPLPMDEDCLTLNLWTPLERGEQRLPVMVWIHGGGFVNGSATAALYDGSNLARDGVVVVGVNYRLGRLGFFAHPLLSADQPDELKGNYALMDQIAALEWVKRNIAAFGGDAGDVTIFGESAGGMAINRLMISPLARGLFHKAVAQSGAGREPGTPLAKAEAQGQAFIESLNIVASSVEALRAIEAETIMAAGDPDLAAGWGPIIDGRLLPQDVIPAFAAGAQARVPYLAGSNALEFPIPAEAFEGAFRRLANLPDAARAELAAAYPSEEAFKDHAISDLIFAEPARHLAALHARAGEPAFLYRFSVLSHAIRQRVKAAPHAAERQYVFRTLNASSWPTDAMDEAAMRVISAYWLAFARTGDPNGDGRPVWPAYAAKADKLLDFTNDGPVARKTPDAAVLDAIGAIRDQAGRDQAGPPPKPKSRPRKAAAASQQIPEPPPPRA